MADASSCDTRGCASRGNSKGDSRNSRTNFTDMKTRTGIEKGNLSRLENAPNPNPTIDTLIRYADAVGKELVIELIDKTNLNP